VGGKVELWRKVFVEKMSFEPGEVRKCENGVTVTLTQLTDSFA